MSTKEPDYVEKDFCCEAGNTVNRRPWFHSSSIQFNLSSIEFNLSSIEFNLSSIGESLPSQDPATHSRHQSPSQLCMILRILKSLNLSEHPKGLK